MTVKRFEDIQVWKDARILANEIYKMTLAVPSSSAKGLVSQIRNASVSIMSNIAEGYERDSTLELIRFLKISKGSAGEVRSLLYLFNDLEFLSSEDFNKLNENSIQIINQISNFIKYLKSYKISNK